jgi:DNA topoisomerase-1
VYASLKKGLLLETITLEEAIKLFDLPRQIGEYMGEELTVSTGRFGPYVKFGKQFVSLKKEDDPYTVSKERAIELIEDKLTKDKERLIQDFGEIRILNGRFGPYISYSGNNYKIPKGTDCSVMTRENCMELIEKQGEKPAKTKNVKTRKTR